MSFSRESFNKHHGFLYQRVITAEVIIVLIAVFSCLFISTLRCALFYTSVVMLGMLTVITYMMYKTCLLRLQSMSLLFDCGKLVIKCPSRDGTFTTIRCKKVKQVSVNSRYIIIYGDLRMHETVRGVEIIRKIDRYGIPRAFSQEFRLLSLQKGGTIC